MKTFYKIKKTLSAVFFNIFFAFCSFALWAEEIPENAMAATEHCNLFQDLMVIRSIDRCLNDCFPVTANFYGSPGAFVMPSARMASEGTVRFGYSYIPPYTAYYAGFQFLPNVEASLAYRVFKGVMDPVLSPSGFGDFSDKGANVRLALIKPEDTQYQFPGIVIGLEDFMGTRAFDAQYIVATQVIKNCNLELSLGYGTERYNGFFGSALWLPFRQAEDPYIEGVTLAVEYDATDYKNPKKEPHPDGRNQSSSWNIGAKWRFWNLLEASLAYVRGEEFAAGASFNYNFGSEKSLVPKCNDPLPYKAPINTEPLGCSRSEEVLVQDFLYALCDQGFILLGVWIGKDHCDNNTLRLYVYNRKYRCESETRDRLTQVVTYLTPSDIDKVTVVIDAEGLPSQQYVFDEDHLSRYREGCIGDYELAILSPMEEFCCPEPGSEEWLFHQNRRLTNFYLRPDYHNIFGSASGKYKYTLGVAAAMDGFLFDSLYYSVLASYRFIGDISKIGDRDKINPSQIINVRTDNIRYTQESRLELKEAFIQKSWWLSNGFYARVSGGYFERVYGGGALELLYYPVWAKWAIGVEGAMLAKRSYSGLGFTKTIRKQQGTTPTYQCFHPWQAFVDFYYDWQEIKIDAKVSIGKFLAKDRGARFELGRYFDSGLRVSVWYTLTNFHDKVNGDRYYDKGIAISMPLDFFFTTCTRRRWNYSMSAWLRDVGARSKTGKNLYPMLHELRQF